MNNTFSLQRRQVLKTLALSSCLLPFGFAHAAPASVDPKRVVALEWLPTEILMALGVAPYGVSDIATYREWVGEPALPPQTIDVGLRTEPNMELLIEMRPSLILYSPGFGPSVQQINRVAPGMPVTFTDGSQPLVAARKSITEVGARLGMADVAQRHLADFDQFIVELKQRLAPYRNRPLLLMTFLDERHALVIGRNSLFQQVMDLLGLQNAWQGEVNFWGSAIVGVERLAAVQTQDVICFGHGANGIMQKVMDTPLWKAMPFIRHGRFHMAPQVWFYGATLSAMRFCHILEATLGERS